MYNSSTSFIRSGIWLHWSTPYMIWYKDTNITWELSPTIWAWYAPATASLFESCSRSIFLPHTTIHLSLQYMPHIISCIVVVFWIFWEISRERKDMIQPDNTWHWQSTIAFQVSFGWHFPCPNLLFGDFTSPTRYGIRLSIQNPKGTLPYTLWIAPYRINGELYSPYIWVLHAMGTTSDYKILITH